MPSIEQQIDDLFATPAAQRVSAVADSLARRLDLAGGNILLFGAGHYGQIAAAALSKQGRRPAAFVDNDSRKQGGDIGGIPVIAPTDIASRYGGTSLVVVTVYNCIPILNQLKALGIDGVTYAQLAWALGEPLLPYCGVRLPQAQWNHRDEIKMVAKTWADEKSRQEYLHQLRWSLTLDPFEMPRHDDPTTTYFDEGLVRWGSGECFVDCGAFDGDSVEAFTQRCASYQAAVGLEPDPMNRAAFVKRFGGLPAMTERRIRLLPYAVGAKKELLTFTATGTAGSAVSSAGITVESLPLDSLLTDLTPTFVKMDIEGAEPYALEGAARLMREHAPTLAVCLYHCQEHLWQLPALIHSAQPKYDLYLRRYADECWETVCYAVAQDRSTGRP
jgi:FkbM family methyltransferase